MNKPVLITKCPEHEKYYWLCLICNRIKTRNNLKKLCETKDFCDLCKKDIKRYSMSKHVITHQHMRMLGTLEPPQSMRVECLVCKRFIDKYIMANHIKCNKHIKLQAAILTNPENESEPEPEPEDNKDGKNRLTLGDDSVEIQLKYS